MFFFDKPKYWWMFFTCFCAIGAGAYLNTIVGIRHSNYAENASEVVKLMRNQTWLNIIFCFMAAFISMYSFYFFDENKWQYQILPSLLIIFLMSALLITNHFRFLKKSYSILDKYEDELEKNAA